MTVARKADQWISDTFLRPLIRNTQRPADVLKMRLTDIRDGCLVVRQDKTGAIVRVVIEGKRVKPVR